MFTPTRKIQLGLLLLLSTLFYSSCRQSEGAQVLPASISSYIYAYTSGDISRTAPVRVRFANSLVKEEQIGQPLKKGVFSLRPSISGTAVWEDDRTILLTPEEYLETGQEYKGKVNLEKLYEEVPKEIKQFEFAFRVMEQNFRVNFSGLRASDNSSGKEQTLSGTVYTSDYAEKELVERLLSIELPNQTPAISWEHDAQQRTHQFQIKGISRTEQDQDLDIKWNGSPFDLDIKGERAFLVPGLNNFQVLDAQVVQDNDQHILVYFSDPLLKAQSLEGLVRISDYNGRLRFNIDGSQLRVYPATRVNGERTLTIESGLKNTRKVNLKNRLEQTLLFEEPKPGLRLVGRGVILPESEGLLFPFEAVNLRAVDVEVFKIYNNNILQFLQTNQMDGEYELERVGKIVMQKQVSLQELNPDGSRTSWTRYALDLSEMLQQDPNSIYQVRLGFRPAYTNYFCGADSEEAEDNLVKLDDVFANTDGEIQSIWNAGYYGIEGYYNGYEYNHRQNPCFPAYYNTSRFIRRNVLASNLGIIAKSANDGTMMFYVTDLRTTRPVTGIQLDVFDYQQQLIRSVKTDGQGIAAMELDKKPFVVVANRGTERGYLRLLDPNALSLSKFDVAGAVSQKGLKGFIYGERGVWRPGDSLYLNFVLEDNSGKLPANHPITFQLFDARNQLQKEFSTSRNVNNVYPLHLATPADAPTGNWRAVVKLGGATFSKNLKIETVKPNRLKIKLDFGKEELVSTDLPLSTDLQVNWLHGAPARSLKAKVEMKLRSTNTTFKKYSEYEFDDPARSIDAEFETIYDGKVNEQGNAQVKMDIANNLYPGKMTADFRIRAFEKGGDFSEDNFRMNYHPYDSYAGVAIPRNRYGSKRIDMEKGGTLSFTAVDTKGEPVKNRKLNVGVYRVQWRWWWERNRSNISMYNTSTHYNAIDSARITTNSKGLVDWDVKVNGWGRYMVRVCDEESGHCSGDFFYAGYPWWGENSEDRHREAAAMLMFSSDKKKYDVGETVELRIPTSPNGRALITIESGDQILESYWKDTEGEETRFTFVATPEMAPTVYAHVSLLQPHGQSNNDLPIRMYGVIPISVEDPKTRLQPELKMADVLAPEEKVKIEVKESSGQPMAYTIAVVDDGLLDLTRFKTPNPWNIFYAREALGVKTWDIFDYVLGAAGGSLDRILSIGGDAAAIDKGGADKANRFKPVVKHFGPFYLEKGKTAKHEFMMPNYVGSVRTMVVASNQGAYGNTEKTTPVRKPLMVLATLPRVLGPGERLKLPVNVFAMDKKVRNVSVKVEERTGMVNILNSNSQSLNFSAPGDEIVEFDLQVPEQVGVARFVITASGGGEKASQEIEIDIRNPNSYETEIYAEVLENGAQWNKTFSPIGVQGTNSATLEVSSIPPLNLDKRINYLLRYPHGCVEQTTSGAFPQLYVGEFLELSDKRKKDIAYNVKGGIERLKRFQTSSGGMAYWPGNSSTNSWGTNYAGHFLLEAKKLGYNVSEAMLSRWKKYQSRTARRWVPGERSNSYYGENDRLEQAYRLYTLALAGSPELGAMNRLREMKKLSVTAKWRLAAAYALAGKPEVANQIVNNLTTVVEDYTELSYTYGSGLRDRAMILETLTLLNRTSEAGDMARAIAEELNTQSWYSTQTTSYSLTALGKFMKKNTSTDGLKFAYQVGNGQTVDFVSQKAIGLIDVEMNYGASTVTVKNTSGGVLYAKVVLRGQPMVGEDTESNSHLVLSVDYKTTDGKTLDPTRIPQGTDFIAEVKVRNPGTRGRYYREMALAQIFPSGWEILNTRMSNVQNFTDTSQPTYRDIRDDRVYSYFDVGSGNTKTYRIQLNAAYQGRYYLPGVNCEAMYDHTINARKAGRWVEVLAPEAGTL